MMAQPRSIDCPDLLICSVLGAVETAFDQRVKLPVVPPHFAPPGHGSNLAHTVIPRTRGSMEYRLELFFRYRYKLQSGNVWR